MVAKGSAYPTRFFKGAGPGTHWHATDARLHGFSATLRTATLNAVLTHIGAYSHPSPYLSVSTSFAIARRYALSGPAGVASAAVPGFVYEIDLSAVPASLSLTDPVSALASGYKSSGAHAHDGDQNLLSEIANGVTAFTLAPQLGGGSRSPAVSVQHRALVFAIRDAEMLVHGAIPIGAVVHRHDVW